MKIYTYYEEINFPQQKELLELWALSWQEMGFEPITLNINDAKKSPEYDLFVDKMRFVFKEITGNDLTPYGLSCFVRWLAYSALDNKSERFLVSDYDVINSGRWTINDPLVGGIHFFDDACPCMASGTPSEFKKLCELFYDITLLRLDEIKKQANHYHDQEFFIYNFTESNTNFRSLAKQHSLTLTRKRKEDVSPYFPDIRDPIRAYHVSHHNIDRIMKKYPQKYESASLDQVRIEVVKEILNRK